MVLTFYFLWQSETPFFNFKMILADTRNSSRKTILSVHVRRLKNLTEE